MVNQCHLLKYADITSKGTRRRRLWAVGGRGRGRVSKGARETWREGRNCVSRHPSNHPATHSHAHSRNEILSQRQKAWEWRRNKRGILIVGKKIPKWLCNLTKKIIGGLEPRQYTCLIFSQSMLIIATTYLSKAAQENVIVFVSDSVRFGFWFRLLLPHFSALEFVLFEQLCWRSSWRQQRRPSQRWELSAVIRRACKLVLV